ncbi:selenium cofactor biosynthesis protein YqeC [uncultured Ilyobacter sp.]|uniref:selenium cofactor biosynthesis protein YqeC n=1 Tax=uncultured Ilyobacter sp. TaxID=544433 RepID=UPI0029C0D44C|nr:selenium cofactor biosynthesis protein YqeC [uncultured Ilyobacter sp.]
MVLVNMFGLREGDVLSIIGAGGKTTFLFRLADELREMGKKVLVTTTTRVYMPPKDCYDEICLDIKELVDKSRKLKQGVMVAGSGVSSENKLLSLDQESINKVRTLYDYILIEADGSRRKPLKGWRENEPVVIDETTKTIAVVDIRGVGLTANPYTIHNFELFKDLTGIEDGEVVTTSHVKKMITGEKGLLHKGKGQEILYFNKVEDEIDIENFKDVARKIDKKIIYGSLKYQFYHEFIES